MRYRLRTLLILLTVIGVALAATSTNFLTLPLRETDKMEASRHLVAWIVDDAPVPGFRETYPDSQWMSDSMRFFVVCDFLPPEVTLSDDPRVQRIAREQFDAIFEQYGYDETAYMTLDITEASARVLVIEFSNVFAPLGGHGYRFEFRRKIWGLRARGTFLWVS